MAFESDARLHCGHVVARRSNNYNLARPTGPRNATPTGPPFAPLEESSMHLTTEAGDPVAPVLFEEDSLGLAPNIVLPEPLPDEDDSGDDPLRTYLREIHEVNLL